ncbi:MAG: DUF86 domain-containing protein [Candidatus Omnitrophica bacterium]|nr:DUF86 domain-containing protein [Candidatus Omnitrophota bacterium]
MKIDKIRIKKFLLEIKKDTVEIKDFLKGDIKDKKTIKAIKYNLIEIVEASANILQHILAKDKGIAAGGYLETIEKSKGEKIISLSTYKALRPFFEFRNILIHRYWQIEDKLLIKEVKENYKVFDKFIEEIEKYLKVNT